MLKLKKGDSFMPQGKTAARNNWIELLRFLFALLIPLYHGRFLPPETSWFRAPNGAVAVEFFFILTGFLMAGSVKKRLNSQVDLGKDTGAFLKKKYLSVFPYHFFSYVCSFLVAVVVGGLTVVGAVKLFVGSLPNLFMLDLVGLPFTKVAGYIWFLSAMFIAIALLYPFLRRWYSVFTHVCAPVLGILLLGWLAKTYGHLTTVSTWTGLTYKGVLQAIAEIALGCAAFELCEKLKTMEFTKFGKVFLLFMELFGYGATFIYAFSHKSEMFYFYLAFFLVLSIAISFSGKTVTGQLGQNRVATFLGKLSLPIYLNQFYVLTVVEQYTEGVNGNLRMLMFVLGCLVMATICLVLVDFLRKKINISKLLVQKIA